MYLKAESSALIGHIYYRFLKNLEKAEEYFSMMLQEAIQLLDSEHDP